MAIRREKNVGDVPRSVPHKTRNPSKHVGDRSTSVSERGAEDGIPRTD